MYTNASNKHTEIRTTDLLGSLSDVDDKSGFSNYMSAYSSAMQSSSLKDYFNNFLNEHPDVSLADAIRRSNIDRSYAYQIISGRKEHPGKYKLALLCLCLGMNLKEIQRALTISGNAVLYVKFPVDAAMIVCINNGYSSVLEVCDFFIANNLEIPEF